MTTVDEAWDDTADVVVVGAGAAGFTSAITARDSGASVLLLEKADAPGGTTAKSGGSIWIPNNSRMRAAGIEDSRADALRYVVRLAYPHFYDPTDQRLGLPTGDYSLIEALYDRGAEAMDELVRLGAVHFADRRTTAGRPMPPYPDYQADLPENRNIAGRMLAPAVPPGFQLDFEVPPGMHVGIGGRILIATLQHAAGLIGVETRLRHRVTRLLTEGQRVTGVQVDTPDGPRTIRARQGVVFTSGGFLHNPRLRQHFLRGPVYGGAAAATSTGDFVEIAGRVGAELGNMTHAWWDQMVLDMAVVGEPTTQDVFYPFGDSVIQVNKYGRRVVNEKQPYCERAQVHFDWNPSEREYSNLVMLQIWDDAVAQNPLHWAYRGVTPMPGETADYVISADTLEELAALVDARLGAFAGHIGGARLAPDFLPTLRRTIDRFNGFAATGVDEDFHRGESPIQQQIQGTARPGFPNPCMAPLARTGPYHCMLLVAGALDTKGGPLINDRGQVLGYDGRPIDGLYGAGNCVSSPYGQSYPGAGATLGAAMTIGYLAGRDVATAAAVDPFPARQLVR